MNLDSPLDFMLAFTLVVAIVGLMFVRVPEWRTVGPWTVSAVGRYTVIVAVSLFFWWLILSAVILVLG